MQIPPPVFRVGDPVQIRGQRWRLRDLRDYDGCRLFTVTSLDSSSGHTERRFLEPFDRIVPLHRSTRPRWASSRRWSRALRAVLASEGPVDALRTAARAAIDLLPHQLEPALALLRGMGTRVLLADEVGLGKTIQAGLAIAELRARGLADRILITTPAGLRDQWREELAHRFSIEGAIIDARDLRRRSAEAPLGVNPWATADIAIVSTDFIKRPEVLPAALDARWDIVVVDEAHGAGSQSERHAAASALCRRAAYVLLLTATPHNGERSAFDALCNLGAAGSDRLLIFRRTRRDVSLGVQRRIHRLHVTPGSAERLMHERLAAFARAVRTERSDAGTALRLGLGVLHKRAFSSPWSLARSVERRLSSLSPGSHLAAQAELPFSLEGDEGGRDDEPPAWTVPALGDPECERRLLASIAEAARRAVEQESKVRALQRLLERLQRRRERAIVFTEYRDTLLHVRWALGSPVAMLHGGLARDERRNALQEFTSGRAQVLLATDAAGEGLNLQDACRVVINLELPWNPNRLEQRAGRVDRIGQRRTVHAFHLIARGTGESGVLERLRTRIGLARQDIDAADPLDLWPDTAADESAMPEVAGARIVVDASGEHMRLTRVRALLSARDPGHVSNDVGAIVVRAHGWLRARLGGRAVAVLRAIVEDAAGRLIAVRLTPIGVGLSSARGPHRSCDFLDAFVRHCEAHVERLERDALAAWELSSLTAYRRLLTERLRREQNIRSLLAGGDGRVQLGLFDRRAEREVLTTSGRRALWFAHSDERIAQLERALGPCGRTRGLVVLALP